MAIMPGSGRCDGGGVLTVSLIVMAIAQACRSLKLFMVHTKKNRVCAMY